MNPKPSMHGWILYSGDAVKELSRACDEALSAGVRLEIVSPRDVDLVLDPSSPARVFVRNAEVPLPMFAIAAMIEDPDPFNLAMLRQLEIQGVLCVNRADVIRKTRDKLLTLQLLAERGIPVPKTIWVKSHANAAFLARQLGLPVVVKILDGSKGHGVSLVHSEKELETLLEMLAAARASAPILAQEFIADSRGRDLRVLVIDGKPRFGMLRKNRSAEGFKSNISAGGIAEPYPLTDAVRDLSLRVVEALGLNLGGIDLLFKGDGFVVGEANSIPGFQGIESCSQINVPVEIITSIGRQLKDRAAARSTSKAESIRSLDELRDLKGPELFQIFLGACASPETVQSNVLLDVVRRNANTEYGKAHEFASIRSVGDFRRNVPVSEWENFEPFSKRMENGEDNLLFAGRPTHFVATSGTTGRIKYIPESAAGSLSKSIASRLRNASLVRMCPELLDSGLFVPLCNAAQWTHTAAGIPVGYASGQSLAGTPPEMLRRLAHPPEILEAGDPETLNYLAMRFAVAQPDVRLLIGNNPARMTALLELADRRRDEILDDVERGTIAGDLALAPDLRKRLESSLSPNPSRAQALRQMAAARGRLEPRDYWPGLAVVSCWLGGTIGRYLDGLKPWLPDGVRFRDCGYGSSEGKFNVPLAEGVSAGPLHLLGCFFEFIPADGGEPLLAHQLEDGREYGLVVTTHSGLYRYDMHDIVRVDGFTGRTPNVLFVSKSREIANLAAEKLSGSFIAEAARATLDQRGLAWKHFAMVADGAERRYVFCVEPAGPVAPDAPWLEAIDSFLAREAETYRVLRGQCMILFPRLLVMKSGWMDHLMASRLAGGTQAGQVKLPVIMDNLPAPEWIERSVETPGRP